jgi:hypothetical protein
MPTKRPRFLLVCGLLAAVLAHVSPALAQPTSADKAAADTLFSDAEALMKQGKTKEACDKFTASQHLDPTPGTLLNLGDCYEKLGALASSWGAFREAESMARRNNDKVREDEAQRRAKLVEDKLPKLAIVVPQVARLQGVVVMLDGRAVEVGVWGSAIPVDPGEHTIETKGPGLVPWSTKEVVPPGAATHTVNVPVSLHEEAPAPPPPPPGVKEKEAEGSSWRTVGLVVGGVGVVGAGVGTVLAAVAAGKKGDALSHCQTTSPLVCDATGAQLYGSAQTAADLATVVFAASGAALGAGVVLFASAPSGRGGAPKTTGRVGRLGARATVGLGTGGFALHGEW